MAKNTKSGHGRLPDLVSQEVSVEREAEGEEEVKEEGLPVIKEKGVKRGERKTEG